MDTHSRNLDAMIAATLYRQVKRGSAVPPSRPTVTGLLRNMLSKSAQEMVTDEVLSGGYTSGATAARRQREQAATRARRESMLGRSGNEAYDALPDVARARAKELGELAYARHVANDPSIVRRNDYSEAMKRVKEDGGVKMWTGTGIGKAVGAVGSAFNKIVDPIAGAVSYFTSAPKGTSYSDWLKQYGSIKDDGSFGHNFVNNLQLQWEGAKRGVKGLGYKVMEYGDLGSWGKGTKARDRTTSYRNAAANSDDITNERMRQIVNNFADPALRRTENGLGKWNFALNAALGQAGGELAGTAGLGMAAKGVGAGLTHGTRALSGAIRGGSAASTAASAASTAASPAASWGARAANWARNAAANGVDAIGDTVSFPFRAAGQFADPAAAVQKGVTGVAKGAWETGKAGFRPVADMWRVARNPSMAADAYRAAGPWRFAGQAASYPFRWGWNTLKPAGRAVFSKPGFEAQVSGSALYNMANGNYGDAAGELGSMGFYGAAGPYALPAILAYSMYNGAGESNGGGYDG